MSSISSTQTAPTTSRTGSGIGVRVEQTAQEAILREYRDLLTLIATEIATLKTEWDRLGETHTVSMHPSVKNKLLTLESQFAALILRARS